MPDNGRIRTPWIHWWRRFRYSVLPAICFIVCVALTGWLWYCQGALPNAVGSVGWVNIPIRATLDGTLDVDSLEWTRFDTVALGQKIATLNGEELEQQLAVREAELAGLWKQREAEKQRIRQDEATWAERMERRIRSMANLERDKRESMLDALERKHDRERELRRLTWDVDDFELDIVDRKARIQEDKIELQRLTQLAEYLARFGTPGADGMPVVTPMQVNQAKFNRDAVQTRISQETVALQAAEKMRDQAIVLRDNYKKDWYDRPIDNLTPEGAAQPSSDPYPGDLYDVAVLLAPIDSAIVAKNAEISVMKARMTALTIYSPIEGTISEVHSLPGQYVRDGDPIVTITAPRNDYVITYLDQRQGPPPILGTEVALRHRIPGSQRVIGWVAQAAGPRYEPVPRHQLRDPDMPQWGRPVRIALPEGFKVSPGELVDVTFLKTVRKPEEMKRTKKGAG